MKAAFFEMTGPVEVIQYGDLAMPEPTGNEVRVKVLAASLNPLDVYIRAGKVAMPLPKPFIPGCDLAGVVEALGPTAAKFKLGDRVWGSNRGILGRQGTFAEYCCAPEEFLYPLPKGVSETDAAAMALVGITAHLGLFWRTSLKAGETIFVDGGTGGVGMAVVQMAKIAGAKVIATAGSPEKAEVLRKLFADTVVEYKTQDAVAVVKESTGGRGVDVFFETVPPDDLDRIVEMMAPRGRIVVMAGRGARPVFPNGPFYVKGLSLFGFVMFAMTAAEQAKCAEAMNVWMTSGQLKPLIGATFPLSQVREAHRLQEANTVGRAGTLIGKIVVVPD